MAADGQLAEVARYALRRCEYFAKRVAELTDNNFRSRCLPPAKSCRVCRCSTPSRTATVEWVITALYYYFGKDVAFTFGTALPFGMNSRMQNAWMLPGRRPGLC